MAWGSAPRVCFLYPGKNNQKIRADEIQMYFVNNYGTVVWRQDDRSDLKIT